MRKILLLSMLLSNSLFWCSSAQALALADIELLSHLNQPLKAKVPLLAVTQDEINSMTVFLRPGESAALAGPLLGLRHEIKQDDKGYYIEITSEKVVREPILSISLELDWSHGQLHREYALLIDPVSN